MQKTSSTRDLESTIRWKKARCSEVYKVLKTIINSALSEPSIQSRQFVEVLEGLDRAFARFESFLVFEEVDNFVGEWRDSGSSLPLHEFLGWTPTQYASFVEKREIPNVE